MAMQTEQIIYYVMFYCVYYLDTSFDAWERQYIHNVCGVSGTVWTPWLQGRGSRNPSTGPATDRSSFIYGGMEGGYAYIDSSYPRRPGDIAKLSSMEFEPTGKVLFI